MFDLDEIAAGLREGAARIERSRPPADPVRDARVERASRDLRFFGETYLAEYFSDPAADYHLTADEVIDARRLIGIVEPREHGKTTRNPKRRALWEAVTRQVDYIVIIRRSDTDVKGAILWLRGQLETNTKLIADFGDLTGGQPWTDTEIVLANGVKIEGFTVGEPNLGKAFGAHRPQRVYIDDPQTLEDCDSELTRAKHKKWLRDGLIPSLAQDGKLIVNQNMIHEDCLIADCVANPMFFAQVYDCILAEPVRQDLWERREEILRDRTIPDDERHAKAERFYALHEREMLRGVELLWPGHWTYKALMDLKLAIGEVAFWAQCRNKPYTGDRAKWLLWATPRDLRKIAQVVEGFDLASSQRSTAAKTAKVQVSVDELGRCIVTEAFEAHMTFGQQLAMVTEKPADNLVARVIESNQYQSVLADVGKRVSITGGATIVPKHTALAPELRVVKMIRLMESGKLLFLAGSPAIAALAQRLIAYRTGHLPDGVSALELAVDYLCENSGGATFALLGDVMP